MRKIEIWGEEPNKEEPPLRLRLMYVTGGTQLHVVDEDGQRELGGHLLMVRDSGYLFLEPCIDKKFGLVLDSHGRLEVTE